MRTAENGLGNSRSVCKEALGANAEYRVTNSRHKLTAQLRREIGSALVHVPVGLVGIVLCNVLCITSE